MEQVNASMITNQAAPVIQAQGIRTPLGSVCACIRYEGLSKGPTAAQTGPFSTHVTSFKSFKHTYAGRDREQLFFQAVFSDSLFQADKARCSHFGMLAGRPFPKPGCPAAKRSETKQQLQPQLQAEMVAFCFWRRLPAPTGRICTRRF